MQLRDDTYRAIELLRFLRRATIEEPWTANELAVAIAVDDQGITSRLAPLYHIDERKEDNIALRRTIREVLKSKRKSGQPIPSIEAVKRTLDVLVSNTWVTARKGRGYWLSSAGRRVSLLEVLHAFGEDAGTSICCRERNPFACCYRRTCRAYKFHKWLSGQLRRLCGAVSIEHIACGTWPRELALDAAAGKRTRRIGRARKR
jgi:DNA-binding IscR family transcriptional regulator